MIDAQADKIQLHKRMLHVRENGEYDVQIELQMVRCNTEQGNEQNRDGTFVGCQFYGSIDGQDHKLYSFWFDVAMPTQNEQALVRANRKNIICFPAQDGKMAVSVAGLGTCSNKYSCLCCVRSLNSSSFPEWMREEFPELIDDAVCKDFPKREGRYSAETCFALFERETGKKNEYSMAESDVPIVVRDKVYSQYLPSLLKIHPDLHSGDPMHVSQGYMTHLTEETAKMLREITGSGWAERKKN